MVSVDDLNMEHTEDGYFTCSAFYPNLRFSVSGHEAYLQFITNFEDAYQITETIRKDRFLDDLEFEWSMGDVSK